MLYLELVLDLDFLEGSVHPLDADDAAVSVEEARLSVILDAQSCVTVSDVTSKALVDFDFPSLASLLLPDDKAFLVQNGSPVESKEV